MTPASVVHGRAASIPGQTAAALQAAGAAVKVQQMAKAEEAARAAAATAAAQRGWERVRQPVQVTLVHTLMTVAWALPRLLWDLAGRPRGTQPNTQCLPSLTVSHATAGEIYPHTLSSSAGSAGMSHQLCPLRLSHCRRCSALLLPARSSGCPRQPADVQLAGPPQPGHWRGLQPSHCCWFCSSRCCSLQAFSLQALQSLAAGVGCHHGMLAVLNLSGVLLDDEGMKVLAKGIHKCAAAVHMLSCSCLTGMASEPSTAGHCTRLVLSSLCLSCD